MIGQPRSQEVILLGHKLRSVRSGHEIISLLLGFRQDSGTTDT
jgi:hypothetical protein